MQARLIEIAAKVVLSRLRAKNEENEDKSLVIIIISALAFVILIAAVFTHIVVNPLASLGAYFDNLDIVKNIKESVSAEVIGSDPYEDDGSVNANASLSDEEMNALMNDPDINEVIKKAVAFCDSKVKAGCAYSWPLRASGKAFDCSSLMWYAYRSAGILLSDSQGYNGWPPTSAFQGLWCEKNNLLVDYKDIKVGDLLFFRRGFAVADRRYKGIGHVAMYVGKGMMVEAKGERFGLVYSKVKTDTLVMVGRPVLKLKRR